MLVGFYGYEETLERVMRVFKGSGVSLCLSVELIFKVEIAWVRGEF